MKRQALFALFVFLTLTLVACQKKTENIDSDLFDEDMAYVIRVAGSIFHTMQTEGLDMSTGPCLSENLIADWVIDVAHNPRDPSLDDDPANQCKAYVDGTARHFVELDLDGKLIRAQ